MSQKIKKINGIVKRHPDGFGFLIPDDPQMPDVYIGRHSMFGIMTNDRVCLNVMKESHGNRFYGEIFSILERGTRQVTGKFFRLNDQFGVLQDEGKGWGENLKIEYKNSMNAKEGELVVAEIIQYPSTEFHNDHESCFLGKVKEVLGNVLNPLTDIIRVLRSQNINVDFPSEVLQETYHFSSEVTDEDMRGRKNLRSLNFVTIDGATAKDFDDAIYVQKNHNGFILFVAIADVSHYVKVGSSIDQEAYRRGTSIYFPNFVVPMLPEVLSNGLCSLNPHVPRLAFVAEIQINFSGEIERSSFYEAVIESKARITYGEAEEILALKHEPIKPNDLPSSSNSNDLPPVLLNVSKDIFLASDLASLLLHKRLKEGSLNLEIPQVELEIDAGGNPIDVIRSERLFSHRLIEELMLVANVVVATYLSKRSIPSLYRIHEPPQPEDLILLEKYLTAFGGKISIKGGKIQKKLSKALEAFEGRPEAQILNILTLRSMKQAQYSSKNIGHFGLGFPYYTHFTSPIRRYPDLIVHRLLKNQVIKNSSYNLLPEEEVSTAGTVLSACEQKAVKAERQVQSIKKARFMMPFLGKEFDGTISSIAKFGIFVLLRDYEVDGLIRIENLVEHAKGERFEFDEENLRLTSRKSKFFYAIGQNLRVRVTRTDVELGQIDFDIVKKINNEHPQAHNEQTPHKEKKTFNEKIHQPYPHQKRHKQKKRKGALDNRQKKSNPNNRKRKKSLKGKKWKS